MAGPDLFVEAAKLELDLPALTYGPVRTPIGEIRAQIRPSEKVTATELGEVKISARTKELVYELPNGEKVIVTNRRGVTRPVEIHGVLMRGPAGKLLWQSHALIDAVEEDAKARGWPAVVRDRARQWDGRFNFQTERPRTDGTVAAVNRGLRPPQIGALHAIGAHWSLYRNPATVVMPTGTGKTETMLSALANFVRAPMLVVVPSDALRTQTARKFLTFGLLRWLNVLAAEAPNPVVGIVTKVPKAADALEMFERCNVVIATMDSLADQAAEPFWPEIARRIGALVIDEAHHIGATRWSGFRDAFAGKPVLQFTATPFRRDGNLVDGQVIFSYPLRLAQADGYFRPITFEAIYEPSQSKADRSIAEAAVARLRDDRANGLNHLMMARCSSIERATSVLAIYQELAPELRPILVHSRQSDARARTEELVAGRSCIAVCVNMLGEGFDLPQLKVAAIHDLHKSLAILLQFTGRFTRSAGDKIGNATVVANIAEPNVSVALERLYSEDADWNELLSEMSSEAAQDHAKLVAFLNEAKRLDEGADDEEVAISHKLLRPTLSTLIYEAESWRPRNFSEGLPELFVPHRVWLHEQSRTLFFVTRSEPSVKWSRSKSVRDRTWTLFVLHHDQQRDLMYLSSSDHDSTFEALAKSVGAKKLVTGETVFRSMGRINRLIFQNLGVKKVGRRNLSYASYTGAEVASALSQAEKNGSLKALLSGIGWEGGRLVTIGCSAKGRVWSREQGPIPRFNAWCEGVGDKIIDASIQPSKLIDNVLLPTVVDALPDAEVLSVEWPVEMLRQAEERITFFQDGRETTQTTCELALVGADRAANSIDFELLEARTGQWAVFRFKLGGVEQFKVEQISGNSVVVAIGKLRATLEAYFTQYPPLFRFVDLSELDANLHITPQSPYDLVLSDAQIEAWSWEGVDITTESMWKNGVFRDRSVQGHVAQHFIDAGFDLVFDDDGSGEAADLVCMKIEPDHIRLVLVHCKFSGAPTPGGRVKDVVEVSSQAVRSARWAGRFAQLCQHVRDREEALRVPNRSTRFLAGSPGDLSKLTKLNRFSPVRPEILIVQPGLSKLNRTKDQSIVMAAAATYLKETVGIDLGIVGAEDASSVGNKAA